MTNEELAVKLEAVDQRGRSNTHRIDELETRQDNLESLTTSVAVMAREQEYIKSDVTEIKTDVKLLTEKPGKRWEGLVDKALWAVAGAVLAWLCAGAPGV